MSQFFKKNIINKKKKRKEKEREKCLLFRSKFLKNIDNINVILCSLSMIRVVGASHIKSSTMKKISQNLIVGFNSTSVPLLLTNTTQLR
jgi:hypothetical protein